MTPPETLAAWVRLLAAMRVDACRRWVSTYGTEAHPPIAEAAALLSACEQWDAWTASRPLDATREVLA